MSKFNFTTEEWKSSDKYSNIIRINNIVVGAITDYDFNIMLLKNGIDWIQLKHRSKSLLSAKAWLKKNCNIINEEYNLIAS